MSDKPIADLLFVLSSDMAVFTTANTLTMNATSGTAQFYGKGAPAVPASRALCVLRLYMHCSSVQQCCFQVQEAITLNAQAHGSTLAPHLAPDKDAVFLVFLQVTQASAHLRTGYDVAMQAC